MFVALLQVELTLSEKTPADARWVIRVRNNLVRSVLLVGSPLELDARKMLAIAGAKECSHPQERKSNNAYRFGGV